MRLVILSSKGPASCLRQLWARCLGRLEIIFYLQSLPHSCFCGRARATQVLLSPSLFLYPNIWETAHGSIYQQATPFQFPTRINHISCKLTIRKEANETTVNITMSNILNTITVTKTERQTLNYSVQERRKAKRDCYIIFCNSEKLNPLHLWATAVKYSTYGIWNRFSKEKDVPLLCQA